MEASTRRQLIGIILLLLLWGCSEERNQIAPRNPELVSLNYDSENLSAPTLEAGKYEAAARFSANQISQFTGDELVQVQYFTAVLPETCEIKVYGGSLAGVPETLLYSADVTAATASASWNTHTLSTPVVLLNQDLWISIAFDISSSRATIGCDVGPAFENGDWLFDQSDGQWLPLSQRTTVDINWNIRALVDAQD